MTTETKTTAGTEDRRPAGHFGSNAAFRAWYERTLPRVYAFLLARCGGDVSLAEELTQLTFTAAIRGRDRFDERADPVTWLCGIGRHKLADHYRELDRQERRHERLVVREIDASAGGEGEWQRADERARIGRALRSLPALQRAAVIFRYIDDLSIREIGLLLDKSESAVESLLSRGREAFRHRYEGPNDA